MNLSDVVPAELNTAPHRTRFLVSSRPSTAMSQLPTTDAMFERFRSDAPSNPGYGGAFVNTQARESTVPVNQSGNAASGLGSRASLFDRTII